MRPAALSGSTLRRIPVATNLLIALAFVVPLALYAPLSSLFANPTELTIAPSILLLVACSASVVLAGCVFGVLCLARSPVVSASLLAIAIQCYLQSTLLLGLAVHEPFTGEPIDWSSLDQLAYLEVAVFVTVAAVCIALRVRSGFLAGTSWVLLVSGVIAPISLYDPASFTAGSHGEVSKPIETARRDYLRSFHRLSSDRNIIHIVTDQMQSALILDIFQSDLERYSESFAGFTLFTQSIGRYRSTYPNIPYIMTGRGPEPNGSVIEEQVYSYESVRQRLRDHSIVNSLAKDGFETFGFQIKPSVFCSSSYTACTGSSAEVFDGGTVTTPFTEGVLAALIAFDVGLFRSLPIVLRRIVHDDGQWFASRLARGAASHSGILDLWIERLEVIESPGTYHFIHHGGIHAPILFDDSCQMIGAQKITQESMTAQAVCSLAQFEALLMRLRELEIYDKTMIIIMGDHGTSTLPSSIEHTTSGRATSVRIGKANALLLIKPLAATGPLQFSDAPATTGDVPATIKATFNLPRAQTPGIALFSEPIPADRERQYYDYPRSQPSSHRVIQLMRRFRIRGNLFDRASWASRESELEGNSIPSAMNVDHPEFERLSSGFGSVLYQKWPVRWVLEGSAVIELAVPKAERVAFVLSSFVPAHQRDTTIEVSIDGRPLVEIGPEDLRALDHVLVVPDGMLTAPTARIELVLRKPESPDEQNDKKILLVSYVGLEDVAVPQSKPQGGLGSSN